MPRLPLTRPIAIVALFAVSAACSPSSDSAESNAAPPAPVVEAPEAPVADGPVGDAPTLSVSEGAVTIGASADSMMMATVGAITRLRDQDTIKALAAGAFAAADADKNAVLTLGEFSAALDHVAEREAIGQALTAGPGAAGTDGIGRAAAFDAAGRKPGEVTADELAAFFDIKRVEADRDFDGKLDDLEFGRFKSLLNGADGSS